jgi:Transposase IS66 family
MLSHHQIRFVYNEGVESVAQTIRQLSEMIEVEDERLQRIIASATTAQLKKIEELTARITQLEAELLNRKRQLHRQQLTLAELNRHIVQLQDQVKGLNKQLTEAREQTRIAREAHLATVMKNSQNSSRPPSSDPHKRRRSLRRRSGRRAGGQTGHRGVTLEFVEQPDHLIVHSPKECHLCGSSLKGSAARKLAHRLLTKRGKILLFMRDFKVPFNNNRAERDLRMLKVKQKVSGCFRTEKGAEEFCRLRSYISTMKKQGHSVMETIRSVFAGKPLMPALRC